MAVSPESGLLTKMAEFTNGDGEHASGGFTALTTRDEESAGMVKGAAECVMLNVVQNLMDKVLSLLPRCLTAKCPRLHVVSSIVDRDLTLVFLPFAFLVNRFSLLTSLIFVASILIARVTLSLCVSLPPLLLASQIPRAARISLLFDWFSSAGPLTFIVKALPFKMLPSADVQTVHG